MFAAVKLTATINKLSYMHKELKAIINKLSSMHKELTAIINKFLYTQGMSNTISSNDSNEFSYRCILLHPNYNLSVKVV